MAERVVAIFERLQETDAVRGVALWGVTALLALAFVLLLISDQVHAATF